MKASYVIKRILLTLFIFFIVITLCFFIPRIGVVDPASRYYPVQSAGMTDEEYEIIKEAIRVQYGLDGSTFEQYIRYLGKLFTGDLGNSYQTGNPKVIDLIASRLPWTLVLSVSNLLISLIIGIIIGTMAAWKRGRWQDRALLNASTFTTALRFVPDFIAESKAVQEAQACRGLSTKGNVVKKMIHYMSVIQPLMLKSLGRSETMALSLELRGFGSSEHSFMSNVRPKGRDYAVMAVMAAVSCFVVYMRLHGLV